jgi:hypothetical protein
MSREALDAPPRWAYGTSMTSDGTPDAIAQHAEVSHEDRSTETGSLS